MFRAPASERKGGREATRPVASVDPKRPAPVGSRSAADLRGQHYLGLQKTIGNQAVLRMLSHGAPAVQDSKAERAAATAQPRATEIASSGPASLQPLTVPEEIDVPTTVHDAFPITTPDAVNAPTQPSPAKRDEVQTRAPEVTSRMERAFGMSFAGVKLRADSHSASLANSLGARAYTDGREIGFGRGVFNPDTRPGLRTIAHEFAHIAQSRGGTGGNLTALSTSPGVVHRQAETHSTDALEADADSAAEAVLVGENPAVIAGRIALAADGGKESKIPPGGFRVGVTTDGEYQYTVNAQTYLSQGSDEKKLEYIAGLHFRVLYPTGTEKMKGEVLAELRSLQLQFSYRGSVRGEKVTVTVEHSVGTGITDFMTKNYPAVPASGRIPGGPGGTGTGGKTPPPASKTAGPPSTGGPPQPKKETNVNDHKVQLPEDLKDEDMKKLKHVLEDMVGKIDPKNPPPTPPGPIFLTSQSIKYLLDIEQSEPQKRQAIIDALKKGGADSKTGTTLEDLLDSAIEQQDMESSEKAVGWEPGTGARDEEPIENRPVHGRIINKSQKLIPGKKAEFYFEVQDDRDAFRVPHISIKWFAVEESDPRKHIADEVTNYIPIDSQGLLNDKIFDFEVEKTGTYYVHAFVVHNFFKPAHFVSTQVTIQTEKSLMDEVNEDAMHKFGEKGKTESYNYDVGGLTGTQTGTVTTGKLDPDARIRKIEDRLKTMEDQEQQVKDLIKTYGARTDEEAQQVTKWAKGYLERLDESKGDLEKNKGATPLGVRGGFASRTSGVASRDLDVLCYFNKKTNTYTLHLHDYSRLDKDEDYNFTAEGEKMRDVQEKAFLDAADTYPAGTLSIAFQTWDEDKQKATDQYIQFTKVTDTVGKKIKSVVFSSGVDLAVNIGALILMVIPGMQLIAIAIMVGYNSAKTISELEDAHKAGTLTNTQLGVGVGMIALNLIPFVGRGAKLITIAGKAFYVVDAISVAGNVMLMTAQGLESIQKYRDGSMKQLASMEKEIQEMEKVNAADPELVKKKEQRRKLIDDASSVGYNTFLEMAGQQAIMMVGQHAISEIASKRFLTLGEMKNSGRFQNEPNAKPDYNFKEGVMIGDETSINPAELEKLQHLDDLNQELKKALPDPRTREQVANALGTADVEVQGGAPKTKAKVEGNKVVLEVADGASAGDVLSEAERAKSQVKEPAKSSAGGSKEFKPPKAADIEPYGPAEHDGKPKPKELPAGAKEEPGKGVTADTPEKLPETEGVKEAPPHTEEADAAIEQKALLEKEAQAVYESAKKKGYGKKKDSKSLQEFIDWYRDGKVYDIESNRWKNREGPVTKPKEFFLAGTKPETAFERLAGDKSTSTFKEYFEVLQKQGLATKETILKDMEPMLKLDEGEQVSLDRVRHTLKEKYHGKLLDKMFVAADGTSLKPEASQQKMLEITRGLNSADKGPMTEDWVQRTRETADPKFKGAPQQVEVKKSDHPAITKDREIDRIEADVANEIKSTDDYLSPKDKAQIDDNLKLVGKDGTTVTVNGKPVAIKRNRITMTSPEGARKNAAYLGGQVRASGGQLEIEVYNKLGQREVFTFDGPNGLENGDKPLLDFLSRIK
jgi:hypothetical protein